MAALVTPRRSGLNVAGFLPAFFMRLFSSRSLNLSMMALGSNAVPPDDWMRTFRIICATMISTCLSFR